MGVVVDIIWKEEGKNEGRKDDGMVQMNEMDG
jgi:hypothetical protein